MMAEKPILFSGEMVRAILASRKTQTRRVVKPQPIQPEQDFYLDSYRGELKTAENPQGISAIWNWWTADNKLDLSQEYRCPYGQPGDILWVRETWQGFGDGKFYYAATPEGPCFESLFKDFICWRPSIHMPRKAARLFLRVTNVRCERLQDISEADARAEGYPFSRISGYIITDYAFLWNHLNEKRGYGWETNPLVWVIEFERVGK